MAWVCSIPGKKVVQWLHFAPFRNTAAYDYFVASGAFEDGYIPKLMSGRYDQHPEAGHFDAPGFSVEEKRVAQLEAYLRSYSPILILNDRTVRRLCRQYGLDSLYEDWRANAPIDDYLSNVVDRKIRKGQVSPAFMAQLS